MAAVRTAGMRCLCVRGKIAAMLPFRAAARLLCFFSALAMLLPVAAVQACPHQKVAKKKAGVRATAHPVRLGGSQVSAPTLAVTHSDGTTHFLLTVANMSDAPLELRFNNSARLEVIVQDAAGSVVWNSIAGQMFAQALGSETIAPHQQKSFAADWNAPGIHGTYSVKARLRSVPPLEAPLQPLVLP